jgi:hypothetical protein
MGGRIAVLAVLGALGLASSARAEDFSLNSYHSGTRVASAEGSVTFNADGGATISVSVTDRDADGACAEAWVTSNLPEATHKMVPACEVTRQHTETIVLPGGAPCAVTFVEVFVGTLDHSENNKIELGESKRMANPCPPPPAPTPVPAPAPPARIDARLDFTWTAYRRWTRNETFRVTGIPEGAAVELRCSGKRKHCPGRRKPVAVRNGRANVHRVLRGRHLRVGAVLELRVTRAGMIGKVVRFKVRRSKIPSKRTYCLPVGAAKPVRC